MDRKCDLDLCAQTWPGDPPKCAFGGPESFFQPDNWNCGVVGLIRNITYRAETDHVKGVNVQYCDDQFYATIDVSEIEEIPAITLWLSWYKHRGATMAMWLLDYHESPKLPSRSDLLAIAARERKVQ